MRAKTRFTRSIGVATAALLATAGLAACGSDDDAKDATVTIWTSVDAPVFEGLKKGLAPKAEEAGVTVKWQRVDNINQLIMTKLQANDAPDIALIPQPGVVADIVKRGKAVALDDVVDADALGSSMVPGTLEAGSVDGKLYGLLVSMNVKSLFFYPKKAWDAAGYQAPDSIDALNTLADQIRGDGSAPYCLGIGSEAATGWVVTDWFEDLIMRYGGVEEYNKWVRNEVKFDSPLVKQAAAQFEKVAFTEGNVPGGRKAIASTAFGDADDPMWKAKPGCWLLKQGSFITGFFPDDVKADLDGNVGVFGFPPATAGGENPVLGGGDMATLLSDSANAKKVMQLLAETDLGNEAAGSSSFISPHKDFDKSLYPDDLTRSVADVAYNSTAFLFDGSDQMPGAVGAGSFWKQMTSWVSDQTSLNDALKAIDASWPTS